MTFAGEITQVVPAEVTVKSLDADADQPTNTVALSAVIK